jgi:hypothetical protein
MVFLRPASKRESLNDRQKYAECPVEPSPRACKLEESRLLPVHKPRRELVNAVLWERGPVTIHVLVMLDIYFVSVKYVLVSVKLMYVYVKLLKI